MGVLPFWPYLFGQLLTIHGQLIHVLIWINTQLYAFKAIGNCPSQLIGTHFACLFYLDIKDAHIRTIVAEHDYFPQMIRVRSSPLHTQYWLMPQKNLGMTRTRNLDYRDVVHSEEA